jgi:uncharacterized ion transporter superfamily protein YfcC
MAITTNIVQDSVTWSGAGDSAVVGPFTLVGGRYLLVTSSSGTANATLQVQSPDGSYVPVGSATTTTAAFDLPQGTYQVTLGASANVSAGSLQRVPFRA